MANDDEQSDALQNCAGSSGDPGDQTEGEQTNPFRKCYMFCPAGDRDRLFEELDCKTAAPLIPAFRDYVLAELERRGVAQAAPCDFPERKNWMPGFWSCLQTMKMWYRCWRMD